MFTRGEGDEATSPSFTAANEAIDASSASLEALIATRYTQKGCKWEHFTHGKQKPVCRSLSVHKRRGRRGNVALLLQYVAPQLRLPARHWKRSLQLCCPQLALRKRPFSDGNQAPDCRQMVLCLCRWRAGSSAILCVNWCLQRVVVSAQLSLESRDAFPKDGNTHLPCWARGPFWRPPSGHFFPSLRFIYPSRSGLIRVAAPFWIPSKLRPFPGSSSGSSPSVRVSP